MDLIPRFITDQIKVALAEARAVGVLGARQTGKSTIVRQIASEIEAPVYDLDDDDTRALVGADPSGFVADLSTPVVIDEVQRQPDLLYVIKRRVDSDQARGQFLITGSSDIRTISKVSDALPGRVDYLTLMPFSQGELRRQIESFLPSVLDGNLPKVSGVDRGKHSYIEAMCTGGYPEAKLRTSSMSLRRFFRSYLASIFARDVGTIAKLRTGTDLHKLLKLTAARTGSLMKYSDLATALAIDVKTVQHHLSILESLKLVIRLDAWSGSHTKRLVRAPKYFVNDSGLLASLIGANAKTVMEKPAVSGQMFETFAVNEILRQISYSQEQLGTFFFRDHNGHEVDLMLETPDGRVIAVEIKAAASISASDFRSLSYLRRRLDNKFEIGILVTTGSETLRFGDRLYAMPLAGLWA